MMKELEPGMKLEDGKGALEIGKLEDGTNELKKLEDGTNELGGSGALEGAAPLETGGNPLLEGAGKTLLDGAGKLEDGNRELLGAGPLELRGWLDDGIAEFDDGDPLELAPALDDGKDDPLNDADAEPTPSVPMGALGSLGEYVVNIDSGPQAGAPDDEVIVVPLTSQPVCVLKLLYYRSSQHWSH